MKSIYFITIKNWDKYNPKHKKTYKSFMFSNSFFSDSKIAQLKPTEVLIFVYLMCVASESSSNQCRISVNSMPKQYRISANSMQAALTRLELLQLVTFEKEPLIEVIKERKNIMESALTLPSDAAPVVPDPPPKKIKKFPDKSRNPVQIKTFDQFAEVVGKEIMEGWLKIYGNEFFLVKEVEKSFVWMLANPTKAIRTPRGWKQFYTNWFNSAFDKEIKKLPSQKSNTQEVFRP